MTRKLAGILAAAALSAACSGGNGGTSTTGTGTTSGSGSTTGGTSGTTSGTTATTTTANSTTSSSTTSSGYCNGIQLSDSASTAVYLATYPKSDEIRVNCDKYIDGYLDAGAVLNSLAGILDRNTYVNTGTLYTVWPAGCDDVDAGPAGLIGGSVVPDGGTSVATAIAGAADVAGPLYGIITYINSPYSNATGGHSGTAWIQDLVPAGATPAPGSGVSIYFPKGSANDAGGTGAGLYPATGISRGDVVAFTNLKWSPYVPTTNTTGLPQRQFEYQSSSTVTVIGQGTLPPAVPLSGADLQDAGAAWMGMRIVQTTNPDTVVNSCPAALHN